MKDLNSVQPPPSAFTASEFQKINEALQSAARQNLGAFKLCITRNENYEVVLKEINPKRSIKISAGLYDLGW
ncbi:MAG: hypothetical protein KF856_05080 [Cyclobacteriaceae bacterium]|nr:hypothetical protein [Cyclobacteriaceae bacterium]